MRRALSAAGMSIALRFWGARRAALPARWGSLSSSRPGVKAAGGFAHRGGCGGDKEGEVGALLWGFKDGGEGLVVWGGQRERWRSAEDQGR